MEWEYACRVGPMSDRLDSAFDFYVARPTNALLPNQANCNQGLNRTCKVGSYEPNILGLFVMHSNVWEWCDDDVLNVGLNDIAADGDSGRPDRGGDWHYPSRNCRAATRAAPTLAFHANDLGLRLAR